MLKVLVGIAIGFVLFTNPEVRQVSADLLRFAGDVLAPAEEEKILQDRVSNAVVETVIDDK